MPRATMTSRQAAEFLGCSRQNVQDLYRRGRLTGPEREPRSPLVLWEDSVRSRQRPSRGKGRGGTDSERSQAAPARIDEALTSISSRLDRLEADADARSTALVAMLGVQDQLEDALTEADDTIALLNQALASSQKSMQARMRASRLRAEVIRQGILPSTVPPDKP